MSKIICEKTIFIQKTLIIGNQKNKVKVYEDDLRDIYNSRTYCLYEDIEAIKKNGLAKGGSLENAIVVKGEEILNSEGLRNNKEFVNHKILDCMGDAFSIDSFSFKKDCISSMSCPARMTMKVWSISHLGMGLSNSSNFDLNWVK